MSSILIALRDREVASFEAGELVLRQGEQTNSLYFLISGEVEVLKDEVVVARVSEPGSTFGEMSAVLGHQHTATVRALKSCMFHRVEGSREFLASSPAICLHVCELLARRLDAMNRYLVDVTRQFRGHDHLGMVNEILETMLHRHGMQRTRPGPSTIGKGEMED